MKYRISKEHVWVGSVEDRAGGLAEKLKALAEGGLNFEFIISRRDWSGRGLLFVSPLRTLEELEIAEKAGLSKDQSIMTIRIETPNVIGLGARLTSVLAEAGISIRDYSGAAIGDRGVTNIAFDNESDTDRARKIIEKLCVEMFPS